jgi:predicted deacylase
MVGATTSISLLAVAVHPLLVKVSITVPVKAACGVKVTLAGVVVCAVELNVGVDAGDELATDHAPVVAEPPTAAPVKVSTSLLKIVFFPAA